VLKKIAKKVLSNRTLITSLCRLVKGPVVIVLAYHDISGNESLDSWLRLPQNRFDEQLEKLGEFCHFIRPDDLFDSSALLHDRVNLLVTFDDGYAGNYRHALPVLEKRSIPALFFISTANMLSGELFWFDKVIAPVQALNLDYLDLRGLGLGEYQLRSDGDPGRRWDDLQKLLEDIKRLGNSDRTMAKAVIDHFSARFSDVIERSADEFRPLKPDELSTMARHPLCSIGSHSHHHGILNAMSAQELTENLTTSRTILESLVGQTIDHMAFPNGDSDPRVRQFLESAGYRWGYGISPGLVREGTDPFHIPRTLVGAYDDMQSILFKLSRQMLMHVLSSRKG
jgi:peptidoglycan/xylan/chitin deacetylase (PgdA/CDA1 family)